MEYVLILYFVYTSSVKVLAMNDFSSEASCKSALTEIRKDVKSVTGAYSVRGVCVKK